MIDNLSGHERLSQKSCDSILHQSVESILSDKSCAENDRDVGPNFAQTMKGFFSIHEWHGQVEQNQLDCLRLPSKEIESFKSRLRGHNLVTCFAQQTLDQNQRHRFVVDHENGLLRSRHLGDRLRFNK